jgi:hypothetical protein
VETFQHGRQVVSAQLLGSDAARPMMAILVGRDLGAIHLLPRFGHEIGL